MDHHGCTADERPRISRIPRGRRALRPTGALRGPPNASGTLFANLPSSAANGSQVYVNNGTAGTPCTGGGTVVALHDNFIGGSINNTATTGSPSADVIFDIVTDVSFTGISIVSSSTYSFSFQGSEDYIGIFGSHYNNPTNLTGTHDIKDAAGNNIIH